MHSITSNLLNEKEPRNRAVQRRDQQLFSLGLGVQITVELASRLRERGKKTLVRCIRCISCTKSEQYVACWGNDANEKGLCVRLVVLAQDKQRVNIQI